MRTPRAVICIETGEQFNSITEAAKYFGIHPSTICQSCNFKKSGIATSENGLRFKYVEEKPTFDVESIPKKEIKIIRIPKGA